jgi:hypothetical protein
MALMLRQYDFARLRFKKVSGYLPMHARATVTAQLCHAATSLVTAIRLPVPPAHQPAFTA